jgi:gluconate 2-dehydrogenase gamma chain
MANMSRRTVIKAIGGAVLTTGLPVEGARAEALTPGGPSTGAVAPPTTYVFFHREEAAFIEAAVSRLIPADEQWPGALEAAGL